MSEARKRDTDENSAVQAVLLGGVNHAGGLLGSVNPGGGDTAAVRSEEGRKFLGAEGRH